MISLKKYLDGEAVPPIGEGDAPQAGILPAVLSAYGSALAEIGNCSLEACPGLGEDLKLSLRKLERGLGLTMSLEAVEITDKDAQEQLQQWGRRAARHYHDKAGEVRDLLLTLARTAESVSASDQRCAGQMHEITDRLRAIASLEDLSDIRASIERNTADLKHSIERMTEESREAVEQLREKVSAYEAKLEVAEELASRDALTKVRSRLYIEDQIERRIKLSRPFCVAIVDIDGFKKINDELGHVVGDEALKQFAGELKSASRSTDLIGRWGGDEFVILFDGRLAEAKAQTERVRRWVCGSYTICSPSGQTKLELNASIGVAERAPNEKMQELLTRADGAMYAIKRTSRSGKL